MRTNNTFKAVITALLLGTGLSGARAASLLADGDFDSLPAGTAPDVGTPAGHWLFPADYPSLWREQTPSQVSIVPVPGGGTGHCLQLSYTATESTVEPMFLPNILGRSVTKASGQILNVSFDIYVEPGRGGGLLFLGKGVSTQSITDRGPQIHWYPTGELATRGNGEFITLISSYPRGVWQTVRLEVDLAHDRFHFYWSERGQPVSVIRSNLTFRSGSISYIDRFTIARFSEEAIRDAHSYFDNIRVTTDPAIAPVNADLATGGATTLQLVNVTAGAATFQWQRNGADIPTATNATLKLSNVTTNQSGDYRAVVTIGAEVVTTDPTTVRVFDQLAITTQPQPIGAQAGKTTGFSVAATGPLPITYQWQLNGVDLAIKTNRFLTLTSVQPAAEGTYRVVVSDATGSVVSQPAPLRVLLTPAFVQAPLSQSVVAGGSVTFSAGITGHPAPFTYQWRKGTSFAASTVLATVESGEKTAFLTLTNVQPSDAGIFRLYLANAASPTITSTSPNRAWTLTVLPDTDGDSLPDEWETANGLNPAEAVDAQLDADGDGMCNLAEYRSGTSPTNAASLLQLESLTPTNGQALVSFSAAANQTYTVEWSDQLSGGSWQKLGDVIARPTDHIETVTDSNAAVPSRFYRVVTPRRP